jgi:hypothetical protein
MGVSVGFAATLFPHRLAVQFDPVRVVDEPVEDAVGDGGIADLRGPARHQQLAGK